MLHLSKRKRLVRFPSVCLSAYVSVSWVCQAVFFRSVFLSVCLMGLSTCVVCLSFHLTVVLLSMGLSVCLCVRLFTNLCGLYVCTNEFLSTCESSFSNYDPRTLFHHATMAKRPHHHHVPARRIGSSDSFAGRIQALLLQIDE